MGFFSLSKKQYNKQQAVGYVVYMMVGSYFHAEDLPRKFHNFHLHYAELPEAQKGKIAELALGYGGSVNALISMGALDEVFARDCIASM